MSWSVTFAGTSVAVPVLVAVRWWRRRDKHDKIARQLARTNEVEVTSLPEHLSPSLVRVVRGAQTLRLLLETSSMLHWPRFGA